MTPAQVAARLRRAAREIRKPAVKALRRGLTLWKGRAIDTLRSRGIGRAIWGTKRGGATMVVKRTRVKDSGGVITAGLHVRGLAALQEAGGRTKPHDITPKIAQRLVFEGRTGTVVARRVKHPGSIVPAIPFLRPTLDRTLPEIVTEMDRAYQEALDRTVG